MPDLDSASDHPPSVGEAPFVFDEANDRWFDEGHVAYRCASAADARRFGNVVAVDPTTWGSGLACEGRWLVLDRPRGLGAERPELHGEIGGLAELAGQELRRIHAAPLPGDATDGWNRLATLVGQTEVDPAGLPEPFRRYPLARLIELWSEGRPLSSDVVQCHGRPRLNNMIVEAGVVTGWLEPRHTIVADRHFDLAIAHRSIQRHLGNDAVFRFYEAYGADPSLPALEHYLLADLLLP